RRTRPADPPAARRSSRARTSGRRRRRDGPARARPANEPGADRAPRRTPPSPAPVRPRSGPGSRRGGLRRRTDPFPVPRFVDVVDEAEPPGVVHEPAVSGPAALVQTIALAGRVDGEAGE